MQLVREACTQGIRRAAIKQVRPRATWRGDPNRGARGHFASEIEAARSDTRVTKGRCWCDPRTAFSPSFYSFSLPPPLPFSIIERDTTRQFFQSNELGKIRLPRSFVSSFIDRENYRPLKKRQAFSSIDDAIPLEINTRLR